MPEDPNAPLFLDTNEDGELVVIDKIMGSEAFATEHEVPVDDPAEDPEYNRAKRAKLAR